MNILIVGTDTCAGFLAQHFLKDSQVGMVYHYGSNHIKTPTSRFKPTQLDDQLLSFLNSSPDIDLIVTTTIYPPLWPAFREAVAACRIPTIMASRDIAMLEWDKIEGKRLLNQLGIPTPDAKVFSKFDLQQEFFNLPTPFVIRCNQDWLNGLQTRIVTKTNIYVEISNLSDLRSSSYKKDQPPTLIVQDYVPSNKKYSWNAVFNATGWTYLGSARSYKHKKDGDIGHLTNGAGSYSPVPDVDARINEYADKIVDYFNQYGNACAGILNLNIAVDSDGVPVVLDINVKPCGTELESIIMTMSSSLSDLLHKAATGQKLPTVEFNNKSAVTVGVIAEQYAKSAINPKKVNELILPQLWPAFGGINVNYNQFEKIVFASVTTNGGTMDEAKDRVYKFLNNKDMGSFTYRNDIGDLK